MTEPSASQGEPRAAEAARRRRSRLLPVFLGAVLIGSLTVFAYRNLPYTGLWYDEAVQFWIARGVDPFTAPGTPGGGVAAVVRINGRANLDPGGFSLLLYAWMARAVDPAWLRTLPLAFFLAGLGAMAGLGWAWQRSHLFALVGAVLPLGSALLLYHATEVRAYTMEFAGVALGCLLLHRVAARPTIGRLALAGGALAFFMSSRYSYTIFAGAVCLALAPAVWSRSTGDLGARLRRLLALGVPILGGAAFVAVNLWLQRGRLTGRGGAYVQYLSPATAAGKSVGDLAMAVGANLLSPVAIPVTLAAIVALMPSRWVARCPAGLGIGASPEARCMYRVAPGVLALSAALWRWHPWDVSRKWSLFLHALSAVLALRIVADVLHWTDAREWSGRRTQLAGTAVATLLVAGLSVHAALERRAHPSDVTPALRYLEGVPLAAGSVAVGVHPYPIVRYLCEAGTFVGRLPYPAAFRVPHWGASRPLVGPETRYLIAHERPDALARMHPGFTFRADPSWPANLYAVEPGGG